MSADHYSYKGMLQCGNRVIFTWVDIDKVQHNDVSIYTCVWVDSVVKTLISIIIIFCDCRNFPTKKNDYTDEAPL